MNNIRLTLFVLILCFGCGVLYAKGFDRDVFNERTAIDGIGIWWGLILDLFVFANTNVECGNRRCRSR